MVDFMELFFICVGAVLVYYGVKLLLFSKMLFPKLCFPLSKTFFSSMGEWAVVTGSSEGIGRAYAFALAERGMNVVLMSRSKAKMDRVAMEIGAQTGQKVKVIVTDFTEENVFGDIEDQLKDLNIGVLVNNVGMLPGVLPDKFLNCADLDQMITKIINCNVKTMAKMCRIILPGLASRGKGLILNISSGVACIPFPMYSMYTASKVFVERFSQALQAEYKDKGVIIQTVAPFGVSTRMVGHQPPNFIMPSPRDFVESSLRFVTAGDKTHGSVSHTLMAWLLQSLPHRVLHTESMMLGLQDYLRKSSLSPPSRDTVNT